MKEQTAEARRPEGQDRAEDVDKKQPVATEQAPDRADVRREQPDGDDYVPI